MRVRIQVGAWATALLLLAGCDNGPSAVETRDRAGEAQAATVDADGGRAGAGRDDERAPTPVTENRRESADAKVARLYQRNGADFGARSPEDYLARVRAFADSPPRGTETAKRPNGDTLLYDPASNTFAVIARDGTPRTMFKPDDGPAYWAEQRDRAATFGERRAD